MKWLKNIWTWIIGAPILLAFFSFFGKWRRRDPIHIPTTPTQKEADKKHAEIDKETDEINDAIDAEFDKDKEDVLSKFGG